jgi:hypothetical protein
MSPAPNDAEPAPPRHAAAAAVLDLDLMRIRRAVASRVRYRYVKPRIVREGEGWMVLSPNCSRNVDAAGGEIPIAWLHPAEHRLWLLHARDHAAGRWIRYGDPMPLPLALERLRLDRDRLFWP